MGIVERKLREKEQRIQEILSAAKALFISKGYSSTTMLDIAQESELSRRTIYLYFKSKEELSFRVMKDAYALLYSQLSTAITQCDGNAYEKLEAGLAAYMEFYKNDFDHLVFTLLFDYRVNPGDMDNEEARECLETTQSILSLISSVVEMGQEDKSLVPLDDPVKTAFTHVMMIQSTMQKLAVRQEWLQTTHKLTGPEMMEEMFRILLFSIKAV